MDEVEDCVSLTGYINSYEEETHKKKKKTELKRWVNRQERRNGHSSILEKNFGEF